MTSRHRACLVPVALALLVTASGAHRTVVAQGSQSTVPSPEQFFGFQMGADRKLANWDKLHEYYQLLAKSSNKMRLVELGKTSEGRPYIALFISSPANLAKLDHYKQINARLADPRGLSEAEAQKARRGGQGGHHPVVRAAFERSGRVADGRGVRLRQPDAHRSRSAADSRQRHQHRDAVDQSRRHADDRRLVHEVCRHAAGGGKPAVAVSEVCRPR